MEVKHPALKYFGSKWRIAPWIIKNLPQHRLYCEPFGGAAAVLLRKPPSEKEVYNDLDGELVNFFQVIQSEEGAARLFKMASRTPYSREVFERAFQRYPVEYSYHPIECALNLAIRSFMSVNSEAMWKEKIGFSNRNHIHPTSGHWAPREWRNWQRSIASLHKRFQNVIIENRDAIELIRAQDREDTLFYVDPPYVPQARSGGGYKCDMTEAEHIGLLECLKNVKGRVVLSGYDCPLYAERLSGWQRITRQEQANMGGKRVEVLWMK